MGSSTFLARKFSSEAIHSAVTTRPPFYVFLLHFVPASAVVVIVTFNLVGYWIGKELSGPYNSDGPKQLSLQMTAKAHEMLMLASLSENLMTHVLSRFVYGAGLPLGWLTSGTAFTSFSYLWSKDFLSTCTMKYRSKSFLVPLLLVSTMLGATVGPSSATALIPKLDEWPAGQAIVTLNTSTETLWPSRLIGNTNTQSCNTSSLGCVNPLVWDSISANLFSYWGHTIPEGGAVMPQHINVPSVSSIRNLDLRLKGTVSPVTPDFSVVTTQHAVMGDLVNRFRFLTFPSKSDKCKRTLSRAMCSYKDVAWSVYSMQPVVFTACRETPLGNSINFPIISHGTDQLKLAPVPVNVTLREADRSQFQWISFEAPDLSKSSIGAIVGVSPNESAPSLSTFACTIQAQWANATTATRFSGTRYTVEGLPNGFEPSILVDEEYQGSTVAIEPDWAQSVVDSPSNAGSNGTIFEVLMALGTADNLSAKLEAIIAVLFAEAMAHTGSGAVPLSVESRDMALKVHGNVSADDIVSAAVQRSEYVLRTTMTGYGYGLYTVRGLSISVLISLFILIVYLVLTTVHVTSLCTSNYPYVRAWRQTNDIFGLYFDSQPEVIPAVLNGDFSSADTLNSRAVIRDKGGKAEVLPL